MGAFALLPTLAIALFLGVVFVRTQDQRHRDKHRRTYRLAFPAELDAERVAAWLRSIAGTLNSGPSRFTGVPTVGFEVWATAAGIEHRLKVPWQHGDYVITQLRSLVPGIRVTPEEDYPRRVWTSAVELGMTHSSRQLRIVSPADLSHSLLATMQNLRDGETLLVQWVISPAVPTHPPLQEHATSHQRGLSMLWRGTAANRDEVNDRRDKLAEPNLLAVLRVAATGQTKVHSDHLVYQVRAALASVRGPATRFTKRFVTTKGLQRRLDEAAGCVTFPMQLNVPEMTGLLAWPLGSPFIAGLPQALSRHLPASEAVPREGRVLGRSNMPPHERLIAMSYVEALRHVHVSGPTGVGKTTLLGNMVGQDMQNGFGVVLIEAKGDLFDAALAAVPQHRLQDVIVLDVGDASRPVGFNVLRQGNPRVVIDELTQLFEHLYPDARGVWTREVLYHGLRTLVTDEQLTFPDLGPLLMPMSPEEEEWRDSLVKNLTDQELRNFWSRLGKQAPAAQERITQPVMDRIWQINARPELRNIIGQSSSSFQMSDVVQGSKILLVNLAGLPAETASLAGTLLMNSLWHAVKVTRGERPTYLYLDEFQSFLNLPTDPEDMLAKARGFGLGMVLAHQHLGQLPPEMKQAIMANTRTKVIFQTSADDARKMASEFGSLVTPDDFMHLGRFEALARISTSAGTSAPLTMTTLEPAKSMGLAKQARESSRSAYGRPVHDVEQAIIERRSRGATRGSTPRPRPPISGARLQ